MYERKWYQNLRDQLQEQDEDGDLNDKATLLLQVEFSLYLLERLGFTNEPVEVLWVLLGGLPFPALQLNEEQQKILARGRILSPYIGRFSWEQALSDYKEIAQDWRAYELYYDETTQQNRARQNGNQQHRFARYEHYLTKPVEEQHQIRQPAKAGERVSFPADHFGNQPPPFEISPRIAAFADIPIPWFDGRRERGPFPEISHADLQAIAQEMDAIEIVKNWPVHERSCWLDRVNKMYYRVVAGDESLSEANTLPLQINGIAHVAGMVGSGKSNLMKLLAFYGAKHKRRVTLVLNDTLSALDTADYFNRLLCAADDPPLAVALTGRTTRDTQLRQLYNADSFRKHPDHWSLRWLDTTCPLQSQVILEEPLPIGHEPCENLNLEKDEHSSTNFKTTKKTKRTCPLFSVCPSQQLYRDISTASIWVTTAGALGAAKIPAQADRRRLRLWELIYEQSELVIFDEVDAVQAWFDQESAPEEKLIVKGEGLLEKIDLNVSTLWSSQRALEPSGERWIRAQQHALYAGSHLISMASNSRLLEKEVERNYFTAWKLLYRLALLLSGNKLSNSDIEKVQNKNELMRIFGLFARLLDSDPQRVVRPRQNADSDPVYRLSQIISHILTRSNSVEECEIWLEQFVPNLDHILNTLANQTHPTRYNAEPEAVETRQTLAQRLELALTVTALDQYMRTMFDEWENGLTATLENQRLRTTPSVFAGLLPVPANGRLFGFYYRTKFAGEKQTQGRKIYNHLTLSVFEYAYIGRWFILNFHHLRQDSDDYPGPNVLALSGTSWLPDSSQWHFDTKPQGVLEPDANAQNAISQSSFEFLPQYETTNNKRQAIFVSGRNEKEDELKKIVHSLAGSKTAPLQAELDILEALAKQDFAQWGNRQRVLILVNSYSQARTVAREFAFVAGLSKGDVCYLEQGQNNNTKNLWVNLDFSQAVQRSDIEGFGLTKSKILVAPIQAIGRGYNILNENRIAAFGAIYFLTRPMPHPYDTQAIAVELNSKTLKQIQTASNSTSRTKTLYEQGLDLREQAADWWRKIEQRAGYEALNAEERNDLAASTLAIIIQACGRLLRGGVPFHAFFVDAAWGPKSVNGERDTSKSSLLLAMIEWITQHSQKGVEQSLYLSLAQALASTQYKGRNFNAPPVNGEDDYVIM